MLAAIYQFEREMILARQREGIALAKAQGKYKGKSKIVIPNIDEYYQSYMRREESISSVAEKLNVSKDTVYRLFREAGFCLPGCK